MLLYFLFVIPPLLLVLYAQFRVSSAYGRARRTGNMIGVTGVQIARTLLDSNGLGHIPVEMVPGELSDHYDPRGPVLRLSREVYMTPSVASLGIVAHEVGHALQHAGGYAPMRLRAGLVPAVNIGSTLGYVFFLLGIFIQMSGLVWIGIILFSAGVVFALVTLPVEFNASTRAMQLLTSSGLVSRQEFGPTKSVLDAAALTYVAALAQALGNLLYWVFLALGMRRND